jgi:hypothetical protein
MEEDLKELVQLEEEWALVDMVRRVGGGDVDFGGAAGLDGICPWDHSQRKMKRFPLKSRKAGLKANLLRSVKNYKALN